MTKSRKNTSHIFYIIFYVPSFEMPALCNASETGIRTGHARVGKNVFLRGSHRNAHGFPHVARGVFREPYSPKSKPWEAEKTRIFAPFISYYFSNTWKGKKYKALILK